jgi:anti-sigma factor RsiW
MSRLNDEERANLSAYLDGELDEGTAEALEAKLATDPLARAEAESLRRTWELLEYLPRTEASTSFTHRTLERLAVQTGARPTLRLRGRLPWWLLAAGWAAALVLAASGGLAASNLLWQRPTPTLEDPAEFEGRAARDLPVIEQKRLYDHADDLEFLRALDQADLFGNDEPGW